MSVRTNDGTLSKDHFMAQRQATLAWMAEHEEIFGKPRTETEVMEELRKDPEAYQQYLAWSPSFQQEFLGFCMGVQGMGVTYDPVFKKIFHPETHPERLTEFLSLCLGQALEIVQVLPNESNRLTEEGSLLVMDILIKLDTGALINVEIQRIGYLFPGARCACYSSDLVMRQYTQVRSQKKAEGKRFSYRDIKNVYTIVLIQESTPEFHALPDQYLHYSKQMFNTGLQIDLLQEYLLIPLDIFRKNNQNISNRLDGWLQFLASNSPEDIQRLLETYPDFAELYREVFHFRYQTKELISMFSKELSILDYNTVQYMVELQQEKIEQQQAALEQQQAEIEQLKRRDQKRQEEVNQQQEALERQSDLTQQEKLARQKAEQEAERVKQENELLKQALARLQAST